MIILKSDSLQNIIYSQAFMAGLQPNIKQFFFIEIEHVFCMFQSNIFLFKISLIIYNCTNNFLL